jgi:hypothetical protein
MWALISVETGPSGPARNIAAGHPMPHSRSKVGAGVCAQPLVVGSEVIVATEKDTVYALDASTGAVRLSRHLATPVPSGLPCGNTDPSGLTGYPGGRSDGSFPWHARSPSSSAP